MNATLNHLKAALETVLHKLGQISDQLTGQLIRKAEEVDWACDDPESPGYVRNRCGGWTEERIVALLEENFTARESDNVIDVYFTAFEILPGKDYTVTYDGTVYPCRGGLYSGFEYLGNLNMVITQNYTGGEPFCFIQGGAAYIASGGSHSVKVEGPRITIHPIENQYIPGMPYFEAGVALGAGVTGTYIDNRIIHDLIVAARRGPVCLGMEIFGIQRRQVVFSEMSTTEGSNSMELAAILPDTAGGDTVIRLDLQLSDSDNYGYIRISQNKMLPAAGEGDKGKVLTAESWGGVRWEDRVPFFDLAAMGLPNAIIGDGVTVTGVNTSAIMEAVRLGPVGFSMNVDMGGTAFKTEFICSSAGISATGTYQFSAMMYFNASIAFFIVVEGNLIQVFSRMIQEVSVG